MCGIRGATTPNAYHAAASHAPRPLPQLHEAFKGKKGWWQDGKKPKLVALQVNSPGGSPVQSSLLYQRIRQLSKETGIPVVAFVE